jgi:hypothetical protein
MTTQLDLTCDGCGQIAGAEHLARRFRRLEWATRYRPVHIQALILGGIAPQLNGEFLYAPEGEFRGEAGNILRAAGVSTEGKARETVLAEFQKLGLMLTHVLECPLEDGVAASQARELMERRLGAVVIRIRRSLKPKRVVLISRELSQVAEKLGGADLACPVWPSVGAPFESSTSAGEEEVRALRAALEGG